MIRTTVSTLKSVLRRFINESVHSASVSGRLLIVFAQEQELFPVRRSGFDGAHAIM